jgi:hypothetical protein
MRVRAFVSVDAWEREEGGGKDTARTQAST